jgi:hypothetical protein
VDKITIPSMDPRGSNRPRRGIVGLSELILGVGLIRPTLWVLDMFGRGESAMDAYKFLPKTLEFAESPLFSVILMVAGFVLLYAFARTSETAKISQLVHPVTKQPLVHPVYPAFRRAAWTFTMSLLVALCIWAVYKTPLHSYVIVADMPTKVVYPAPPDDLRSKVDRERGADIQLIHDNRKLDGQTLFVNKDAPRMVVIDVLLKNVGIKPTDQTPTSRLYLSKACAPFGQFWQVIASDEPMFPAEFYLGATLVNGVTIQINREETWSWPEFSCTLSQDITDPITGKIKVFYGAAKPSEASFSIRKKDDQTAKPISR